MFSNTVQINLWLFKFRTLFEFHFSFTSVIPYLTLYLTCLKAMNVVNCNLGITSNTEQQRDTT